MTAPANHEALPEGLLLAYYGDDFTGSTDTMEVMTFAGLRTVLFTREPTPAELQRFAHFRAIGIAGIARSCSPAWMHEHLPSTFRLLFSLEAPITQYKVCSTFDSSPTIGSIGTAIDLALPMARESWSPVVVGAPQLRRWQCFGNLFAGVDEVRYRLDRHPTMSRHPSTPMLEADIVRHLAAQTQTPIRLVDMVDLSRGAADARLASSLSDRSRELVLFDVPDEAAQVEVGRLIWANRGQGLFSASSSGLQYALVAYWRNQGWLSRETRGDRSPAPFANRMLVLSGSCSPVTGKQIDHAVRTGGFVDLPMNVKRALDPVTRQAESDRLTAAAGQALAAGRVPLVYSARGPEDPAIAGLHAWCASVGSSVDEGQAVIGDVLGAIGDALVGRQRVDRLVVAGGDTSGRVTRCLPILALEATHPLAPGSPICRVYADQPALDELQIVLKGGQVGKPDFFLAAQRGHGEPIPSLS